MGFEQAEAAALYSGRLMSFSDPGKFPYGADCTTYSANSGVTDSAAAGTALATHTKVNNGVISMAYPGDQSELLTLLEYFKAQGKATGLVTTSYLTDATPAAFGAHESTRSNTSAIAGDYLNQTRPNVLYGGGGSGLTLSATTAAGYAVATDSASFENLATQPVSYFSAQFGTASMPYKADYLGGTYPFPELDTMTSSAISILSQAPEGFFLMVEGGNIDHACHLQSITKCVHEVTDFSDAVDAGYNWALGRSDTLILVTADHETGGLTVDGTMDANGYPVAAWTTTGHTGTNVPVYAWGVNAELVHGTMDNSDMFNVCSADIAPALEATNPYPSNGATGVPPNVTLTWTPGTGAAYHRISVWTEVEAVLDVDVTTPQQPLQCAPGTTYFWTVSEYDGAGVLLAPGQTWTFTTLDLPTAPTNLSPSGSVVPVNVQLSWTSGTHAQQYRVYLGESVDSMSDVSTQTGTSYSPSGLTNSATYYWRVVALNPAGEASSETAWFTTEDLPQPEPVYADSENTVAGARLYGDLLSLTMKDESRQGTYDGYEVLQEVANVPNKNAYSTLNHVWTFDLGNAVSAEFYVEAFKTASTDGDDFVFSYSTDGVTYLDMLTVTRTEDTNAPQVYVFPTAPTGTVYVRATDTNHTKAHLSMDTLYIDHMYVYASEGAVIKHYKASQPVPADGSVDVPLDQTLSWTAGDEAVLHRVWFGEADPTELAGPFEVSEPAFDPGVWAASQGTQITGNSAYFWRVDEVRADGTVETGDVWRYTTTASGGCNPTNLIVQSIVLSTERVLRAEVGVATVTVVDNCGNAVAGAVVTGRFTGDFSADSNVTATTDDNGVAVFRSSTSARKPSFGFEVMTITADGLIYP